jgi:hypothetical protein
MGGFDGRPPNVTVDAADKVLKPDSMDAAGTAATTEMLKGPPIFRQRLLSGT